MADSLLCGDTGSFHLMSPSSTRVSEPLPSLSGGRESGGDEYHSFPKLFSQEVMLIASSRFHWNELVTWHHLDAKEAGKCSPWWGNPSQIQPCTVKGEEEAVGGHLAISAKNY